jgi:hypothetical protein
VPLGTVAILLLLAGVFALLGGASAALLAQGWLFPAVTPAMTVLEAPPHPRCSKKLARFNRVNRVN